MTFMTSRLSLRTVLHDAIHTQYRRAEFSLIDFKFGSRRPGAQVEYKCLIGGLDAPA